MDTQNNNLVRAAVKAALISGVFATAALPAFSAEEEKAEKAEKITVTGSSIKRNDYETSLPVQIIGQEEIARSGVKTVTELAQQLPVMQGYVHSTDSVGGGGGGITTTSIHDIGSSYTLVLLNGRRLAPADSGSTIDLNAIPLSTIERVEVLTDGASALYGSDAIAGVVNFITKKNQQGVFLSVNTQNPEAGDGDLFSGDITAGFGDMDTDGYNIQMSYSRDVREQVSSRSRDYAQSGIIEFKQDDRKLLFFNGSANAIPGTAFFQVPIRDSENKILRGADGSPITSFVSFNPDRFSKGGNASDCAEFTSAVGNTCQFDYTSTIEIFPEDERDSFMVNGQFELSNDLRAFTNVIFTDYSVTTRIAPYPTGLVPVTDATLISKYFTPYLDTILTATQKQDRIDENISGTFGAWRAIPAGNRTTTYNTQSINLVAGLEGVSGDIEWEAAFNYAENDSDQNYTGGWLLADEFRSKVASGALDIFGPIGSVTPAQMEGLTYNGNWSNTTVEMISLDARGQMPAFMMDGGEAYLGFGVDFRDVAYQNSISQANKDAVVLFLDSDTPYKMDRQHFGAFAELAMPIMDRMELNASVRYDNIGAISSELYDANKNAVGSTNLGESEGAFTYKLSGKFDVNDSLTMRASYGTGFKAPDMLEIGEPLVDFGVTSGNYVCPFQPGDPLFVGCDASGPAQYSVLRSGNAQLKNEKSTQFTAGVVFAPSTDFNATVDYWTVELEDGVTSITERQIFDDPTRYRDLFSVVTRNDLPRLAILRSSSNVGESVFSGIDYNFQMKNELGIGLLKTSFGGTYMIESEYLSPGTTDEWLSSMSRFGENSAITYRQKARLSSTLVPSESFAHTLTLNYLSGYQDVEQTVSDITNGIDNATAATVQLEIPSYKKLDYVMQYTHSENASLTFGINNLTRVEPSLSLRTSGAGHQLGFDPRYYDVFGRTFYVQADYSF